MKSLEAAHQALAPHHPVMKASAMNIPRANYAQEKRMWQRLVASKKWCLWTMSILTQRPRSTVVVTEVTYSPAGRQSLRWKECGAPRKMMWVTWTPRVTTSSASTRAKTRSLATRSRTLWKTAKNLFLNYRLTATARTSSDSKNKTPTVLPLLMVIKEDPLMQVTC